MRFSYILLLAAGCGAAWAGTNSTGSKNPPAPGTEISSDSAVFDNNTRRLVYMGDVLVSDPKVKLHCERLTVDLPPSGQPTNVVAETNVVIDFMDEKGNTNHVSSDKAVYTYMVVNSVTNETVKFTGNPLVNAPQGTISSEPLIWDRTANQFYFYSYRMLLKHSLTGGGTNSSQPKLY